MNWRNPILGLDTRDGGAGILNGLPYWNMDFSIKKNIRVTEGVSLELQGVFANVFNHKQWIDNYLVSTTPADLVLSEPLARESRETSNWACGSLLNQ